MAAPKPITLYTSSRGLNTRLDPQRLLHGTKDNKGEVEFAQGVNISIDDRGLASLREGDEPRLSGKFHSLFCDGGDFFAVQDGISDSTLHKITLAPAGNGALQATAVRTGLALGARVSFAQAGPLTLYANGAQHGIITGGVSGPWSADQYNGHEQNVSFLASVPVANHIGYDGAGTIALAVGNVVLFNFSVFSFGLFSEGQGWIQCPSSVRMLTFVETGWFISDQSKTRFFRGFNWNELVESVPAEYPAHEWSCANERLLAADMGLEMEGHCAVWSSPRGICLGTPAGTIINLTENRIDYPVAYERAACLILDNKKIINTVY